MFLIKGRICEFHVFSIYTQNSKFFTFMKIQFKEPHSEKKLGHILFLRFYRYMKGMWIKSFPNMFIFINALRLGDWKKVFLFYWPRDYITNFKTISIHFFIFQVSRVIQPRYWATTTHIISFHHPNSRICPKTTRLLYLVLHHHRNYPRPTSTPYRRTKCPKTSLCCRRTAYSWSIREH